MLRILFANAADVLFSNFDLPDATSARWRRDDPDLVNIHHLELFYHVARNGGISHAVRKMPYGIQQPAVSGQILQLEAHLGIKLFQRRPFVLTPAGRELFEFVAPFFSKVLETGERLRGETSSRLRLAAPSAILRDHLPKLLEQHRAAFPQLRLSLHDANQAAAEDMLHKHDVDLAITELEGRPAAGIHCYELLKLPLQLLLSQASRIRSASTIWKKGEIVEPLICMPASETISKLFHEGLRKISVNWPTSVEVSSLDLMASYVRAGFGIGVSVFAPGEKPPPKIRLLRLRKFPPLIIAALWQTKLPPVAEAFLEIVKSHARTLQRSS